MSLTIKTIEKTGHEITLYKKSVRAIETMDGVRYPFRISEFLSRHMITSAFNMGPTMLIDAIITAAIIEYGVGIQKSVIE